MNKLTVRLHKIEIVENEYDKDPLSDSYSLVFTDDDTDCDEFFQKEGKDASIFLNGVRPDVATSFKRGQRYEIEFKPLK